MNKELLENYLKNGISYNKISKLEELSSSTVGYYVNKYELNYLLKKPKRENYYFDKIDSIEKAYVLGFLLGDSHIDIKDIVSISIAIRDKEIAYFIENLIGGKVILNTKLNKKTKQFPKASLCRKISDIRKFTGGRLKEERHYPIVKRDFEKYLLLGFFDAEGCITWGRRKDRNRIWQKVSFTGQYKSLEGIQNMIYKHLDISTKIRPKSKEKCFVLEFSAKDNVLKFMDFLYKDNDLIVLKRKYINYKALRLELEEFGGK